MPGAIRSNKAHCLYCLANDLRAAGCRAALSLGDPAPLATPDGGSWELWSPTTNRSVALAYDATAANITAAVANVTGVAVSTLSSVVASTLREGAYLASVWNVSGSSVVRHLAAAHTPNAPGN